MTSTNKVYGALDDLAAPPGGMGTTTCRADASLRARAG